ncbi:exodeoxyribonuclease V subunit beta [Lysobacter arseniciresistens ZS79]|uniref:RecBCD enzyme subunit RecB n=1 Tax=Lysobacter arseniciresistens ZS79 TaxID=913325 RepID=A0A0A0ET86_9GAMM|nr:exodeoxyribonuclease V subunit beta [Lysobacter arseniciresistens]KGM53323.1 exodeoxyribonuclease V subunit beta [Lysobacter arseniciresistens ZS79]
MNAPAHPLPVVDPYLDLPLDGVRLIEASAGTGKTFTLATLVTRLVVERGLRIGQVLAVTFTEAATQELRSRIRERLELAARLVTAEPGDAAATLSRDIVERHLAAGGETRAQLARRLRQAVWEVDLAAIFTIHGFCARLLREHALESGHGFDPPTLLTSDAGLREELAADLWRVAAADPEVAPLLPRLWTAPKQLQDDLRALLSADPLLPAPVDAGADPLPTLEEAGHALCAALAEHGDDARAEIGRAFDTKVFDGRRARRPSFEKAWATLCAGSVDTGWSRDDAGHLDKLLPERMRGLCKDGLADNAPCSPLFDALAAWFDADDRRTAWLHTRTTALLHRIRDDARARLATLKRTRRLQTYDDLIDGVADALAGEQADALVAAVRGQYAIALVDEFQDTDPRQWAIFNRLFGAAREGAAESQPPALFLIGDPKQAIYGFRGGDVQTYLAAAAVAEPAPPLDRNFRSRPAVLDAIAALYKAAGAGSSDAAAAPFLDERIRFLPVHAGGRRDDADFQRGGTPAPALTVRVLTDPQADPGADGPGNGGGNPKAIDAERSRELATGACVAAIHALLVDARAGTATLNGRPVEPGDIAVLVRSHREATQVQLALSAAGIPAVAAGKQSLFATDEARELLALFEALLHPADDSRLRAALATLLVGLDAAAIAALDDDGAAHARWQQQAQDWRERWQRNGPLALVADRCAAAGERLLGLLDGERRLTNTLQLAELMQEAQARMPGLHGQLDWLRNAIAEADRDDEAQLLRLESDARRVQIVTLHKSKGLEYPLVFLPFIGIGRRPRNDARHHTVHDGDRRVLHWKIDKAAPAWKTACDDHAREQQAEDARLLYVGLTRARDALWLATGRFFDHAQTRLAPMLEDLDGLRGLPMVAVDGSAPAPSPAPLPPGGETVPPPVRVARRELPRDWWVYSFTQLARADAGEGASLAAATRAEQGADDEALADPAAPVAAIDAGSADEPRANHDPRFAGSRFGNVLHDVLEHVAFDAWRDWRVGEPAPPGQDVPLRAALRAGGYPDTDLDDGIALLAGLVGHTLVASLPEGGRLCGLAADARRAEMEFHFALAPTRVDALIDLLHRHGVLRGRRAFGARQRLEGLMTGKIDLTYTAGGRWYVLDYKSNRLPGYDAASLDAAMAHSEYDLQALLYTLALHRWLRFRLGADYDYARDFGGVRYVFSRGLAGDAGEGIHAHRPAPELVHALDALFAGDAAWA